MSKTQQNQSNKQQSRSHSVSGKNYAKIGRNITKTIFSPLKSIDGQQQNMSNQSEQQMFQDFINAPFQLDFLKNQQIENSKYSMSRHPNQMKKPLSALNQNPTIKDKQYMNLNSTWNPDDSNSIDENNNEEDELVKLQRKLRRKKKETAVFKSIERNILPSWVKAKQPEKSYEFRYTTDLSSIKAKSPSAFITKQQNFSLKNKIPSPRPYDINVTIQVCKKNPLVKLDIFSTTLAALNSEDNQYSTKFQNEEQKSIISKTQKGNYQQNFKTQQLTPKARRLIELNNSQSNIDRQNLNIIERTFMSVNGSRNTSPKGLSSKKDTNLSLQESPINVNNTLKNVYNMTSSTTYNKQTPENTQQVKNRVDYQFKKLTALEELEQQYVDERYKQKQINIPQIGKYSIRKPLFSPRNTSNEIYTNDLVKETYANRLYQVSKIRDFSTYVGRKDLFQSDNKSPDQGYYNQNFKHTDQNYNNVLVDIAKSSPRKTVFNLQQYPEQHVLLDYEVDKISHQNTKTLAHFSKMVGRKGNSFLDNSIVSKTLQNKPYSLKV